MHIALLGPIAPPAGGVQSHMSALQHRLREAGHRVSLVALTRGEPRVSPDTYYPTSAAGLLTTLLRLKPDVVHLHFGGDLSVRLALLCGVVGSMPLFRSVLTCHSGGFPRSPRGLRAKKWSAEGVSLRRLDAAIAVNAEIADLFRRYGIAESRVHQIAPHANVDRAAIAEALPAPMAEFYASHSPVFVSVGLLEPEYCLELQIDVLPLLRQRWENAGLVLIGSGTLHDALRERIERSHERAHIALVGNADHKVALKAISEADVLLRTTKYDGDAVSVREALQLGTHVVASDTGMRPAGVTLMPELSSAALITACQHALLQESTVRHEGVEELSKVVALYHDLTAIAR